MENPQLEQGYVRIASDIMDALCRFRIPGQERQVLDCIIRLTYGYNKKEDWITLSQIAKKTGMSRQNVRRAYSKLTTNRLVVKSDYKLRLNKDFSQWQKFGKRVVKSDSLVVKSDYKKDSKQSPTINNRHYTKDKEGGILTLTTRQLEKLKKEYANVDIETTYRKFRAWQRANDKSYPNVLEAFKVWLISDNVKNRPTEMIRI